MVHSYGAPIKTRDCPRQIEPIFQEHLSRAPLLFSSIRLGAEKRLETFSFRQQEERERASSFSFSPCPMSFQFQKRKKTYEALAILSNCPKGFRRATDATNGGASCRPPRPPSFWEERRRMDGRTRMDARGHGQKELGYL